MGIWNAESTSAGLRIGAELAIIGVGGGTVLSKPRAGDEIRIRFSQDTLSTPVKVEQATGSELIVSRGEKRWRLQEVSEVEGLRSGTTSTSWKVDSEV